MASDLLGLILTGGTSSRMGKNKALLNWRGQKMFEKIHDLIAPFCTRVYLSCSKNYPEEMWAYSLILDNHGSVGPLDGIVTAMEAHPDCSWLVAAVDLPLATTALLNSLVDQRDVGYDCTLFRTSDGRIQPLLAIYEPSIIAILRDALYMRSFSLSKVLEQARCQIATHSGVDQQLFNMNFPRDFETIKGSD